MLSAAIITFREIFEVCLIISIISAALSILSNRKKILAIGITGGAIFSILIALSFSYISTEFSENGQDLLNVIILILSIFCIAYTSIFISNQTTKEIHYKIDQTAQKIVNQELSSVTLMIMISLLISREGAELIIFLHGIYASGQPTDNILLGSLLGSSVGLLISFLFYTGLLKIPFKYLFRIINILLILMAAGMASQLANLLHSIDFISIYYEQVWDSSWLISDNTLTGKILYNLIGYSARPTQLQILCYISTIIIFISLIYYSKKVTK